MRPAVAEVGVRQAAIPGGRYTGAAILPHLKSRNARVMINCKEPSMVLGAGPAIHGRP